MLDSNRGPEKDDFWAVEKLVPKRKGTLSRFSYSTGLSEHYIDGTDKSDGVSGDDLNDRRLTLSDMRGTDPAQITVYRPEGSLIKCVKIQRYIDKYDFYDTFRKSALNYFDYKAEKCDFVQFYSYRPQYSQMTKAQKNYYFFWREEFRNNRCLKTDYSYVYLLVYEILNLPDKIAPDVGIRMLCRLWREYRSSLNRLDNYMSIWVQDYCLVHQLDCPMSEISDFIYSALWAAPMKEFYLLGTDTIGVGGVSALLSLLSDYDWHCGRYASGSFAPSESEQQKYAALYKMHMESAMHLIFKDYVCKELFSSDEKGRKTLVRDAFPNSLCTHSVKCRLEIEYVPIGELGRLRDGITGAVRYTENKLRAFFGAKSRLAVKGLPEDYKRVIDFYFDALAEGERIRSAKASVPEYERLYDAPKQELSYKGADEIERMSWDVTARLVAQDDEDVAEAADEADALSVANGQASKNKKDADPDENCELCDCADGDGIEMSSDLGLDSYGLSGEHIDFLYRVSCGARVPTDFHSDAMAEYINEAFADRFGDIVLESDGVIYTVIRDYEEDIKNWLQKIMK